MNPGGYWYGYGYQQPQVPLRKGWTKKVPGPSQFGTFHAYYSPTTGLSGGGKWGAEAVRAKVDSNPVGALQELCQKVKVIPFYQDVVGAPRHTVQMWGMGPSFEGYGGEEEWGEECYGDLNAEYNGASAMMNQQMFDNSGVFMGHDGTAMDYGGEMMEELGGGMEEMGAGMMGPMGGMMMMGGMEVAQRGNTRGSRGSNTRGGEYFPPRRGVLNQRFPWSQGVPGGPRGKGGRGGRGGRGQGGPSLGNANLTPLGGNPMRGGMRGMGSTRFGFGSMGMMFGRGGFRGGRGNSGGFHEESYESFQARCNPQAAFTIGAEANEAFKNQFRGMGTRNSVAIRGWGAQPPLKKKAKVPPVNLPSGEIAYGQDGNKKTAKRKAAKNMLDILDGKGGQGPEEQEEEEEEEEEEQYEEEEPEQPAGAQDGAGPSSKPGGGDSDDAEAEEYTHPLAARIVEYNQSLEAKLKNMHRGSIGTGRFAGVFDKASTFVPPSGSDGPKALTYQPQSQSQYTTQYERHLAIVEARRQHQEELIKQQCEYGPLGVKLWFSKEERSKVDSDEEETETSKPNRAPEEDHVTHHHDPEYSRKDPEEASFTKKEFTIQEPLKPIVPETLEEWLANVIMKETNRRIDKKAKKREKKRLEAMREQMAGEGKSMGDIEDLLKQSKEEEPDFICKMCNLVFVSRKHYEVHKVTSDHLHVVKGFFPGEGGYHCFLCWLSFQQAEGLLNHIERNNHLEKCERKGVLRIWMAPTKVSDMDMFKTFKTVAGQRAGRIGERRRTRSRSRSRRRSRERSKRPRLDSRERDMGERLRQRERSKERSRRPSPGSLRPKKGRGGKGGDLADNANLVPLGPSRSRGGEDIKSERDSWYADPEARSVEDRQKCESFEWNDVKGSALLDEDERERKKALKKEKESLRREKEALKASSSSRRSREYDSSRPSSSRQHDDDRPSSSRHHDVRDDHHHRRSSKSKSSHRESERASGSSRHREQEEIGGSYWESHSVKLEPVEEQSRRSRRVKVVEEEEDRGPRVKVKKEKRDKERRKERRHSKRSSYDGEHEGYHDDHEEVNEVQDGFEIDSVGKVENSEETLQKMKSAIIGILDEEIFTLAKKIKD